MDDEPDGPPAGAGLVNVTFLGTGTSSGVPVIGCDCAVCRSTNPHDSRLRPSIYVDVPGRARILVDTGSDLRQQAVGLRIVEAGNHCRGDHDDEGKQQLQP